MTGKSRILAGYCGKLPIRSDFVLRRVPLAFVERWHDWIAAGMASARSALGEGWLDAYLHGPVWRFALPPGLVGPTAMAGTLMPSVDATGRYFPLTLVLPLPSAAALASTLVSGEDWFAEVEALSLAVLEQDIDPDSLSERLLALALPPLHKVVSSDGIPRSLAHPGIALLVSAEREMKNMLLAAQAPAQLAAGNSVWWTAGSATLQPTILVAVGLPEPRSFAAMLNGDWTGDGWAVSICASNEICGRQSSETP